jgi:predicted phosphoribosyltransferase
VLAKELGAELDVVLSRKLRAPSQPEVAVGAIAEDGRIFLTEHAREATGLTAEYLGHERRSQRAEIARRRRVFRSIRAPASIAGRSVMVADDGMATGSTMIAALQAIMHQEPEEIIVAVPVASPGALRDVRPWCDDVVCLLCPRWLGAISQYYADYRQVDDEQAVELFRVATLRFRRDRGTSVEDLSGNLGEAAHGIEAG